MSSLRLTTRDRDLFRMIGERGCVPLSSIHHMCWPDAKESSSYARVRELVRAGYMLARPYQVRGRQEMVYFLTHKARILFDSDERQYFYPTNPTLNEIRHCLLMSEVLDALYPVEEFKNERILKREAAKEDEDIDALGIADGFLTKNGKGFLIEIDGAYFGEHLLAKAEGLEGAEYPVKWVTWSRERQKNLKQALADCANIEVVLFDELIHVFNR